MSTENRVKAIAAIIIIIFMMFVVGRGIQEAAAGGADWSERIYTTIVSEDGRRVSMKGVDFPEVGRGDVVWLDVELPEEERIHQGTMCFVVYNSVTDAFYGEEIIYNNGGELYEKNLMLGQRLANIPIPEEAWGSGIRVRLLACEEHAFAGIGDVRIYPAGEAYRFISEDNVVEFISAATGMCGSMLALILLLVFGSRRERKGVFVAAGTFALALWEFTIYGQHHIFSESYFWVVAEYVALMLCPPLMLTQISVGFGKGKKLCRIVTAVDWIWCVCALVLHFSNLWHLSGSIVVTRVWIAAACIVAAVTVLGNRKSFLKSEKVKNVAILALAFWGLLASLNFYLGQWFNKHIWGRDATFSSIGLILFMVCMVVYLVLVTQEVLAQRIGRELEAQKNLECLQKSRAYDRLKLSVSQLQPHFLYNVLYSIQTIIKQDSDYAYELLYDFMTYLRGNIDMLQSEEPIEFERELENIEAYMNIEKMRYPERNLSLRYDLGSREFKVAPLAVEMLVENAARYGRFPEEGGEILVRTEENEREWVVEVSDNGGGFDLSRPEEEGHTGIRNMKLRMELLLNARVTVESKQGVGTKVVIGIPKDR